MTTTADLIARAEIADLLSAYTAAIDVLDIDAWADCFTPDGVFHGALESFRAHADRDAFAAHARELEAHGMPRLRHFLSNVVIDLDGDRTDGTAYSRGSAEAASA